MAVIADKPKELVVLVTGYAPFLAQFPQNASWEICSRLPDAIPATTASPIPIRLIKYNHAIPVCYSKVMDLVPQLLSSTNPKPDIIFHMGLAGGRTFYTLESQSTRGPYTKKQDMEGRLFDQDDNERQWGGLPEILRPTFDFDDVFLRCKKSLRGEEVDVRPSDNCGRFLCGFIYYASMAWYVKRESSEVPVMFLHVPDCPTPEELQIGQRVTLAAIRALVDSRAENGIVRGKVSTLEMSMDLPSAASGIVPPGSVHVANVNVPKTSTVAA